MSKIGKGISIFAAWPLMLALLLGSIVAISFSPNIYSSEQEKLNISEAVGCSPSVLENITNRLIGFMKGGTNAPADLNMNAQINGENREVFSNEEKYHMYDVKYLFDLARYVFVICVIVAMLACACAFLLGTHGRRALDLSAGLLWGMASFVVIAAIFAVFILIDFEKFWISFHQMFFANDLWQLDPSKDILIQMMPQQFFQNMIFRIGVMFMACAGAIALAAGAVRFLIGKKLESARVAAKASKPEETDEELYDETVTAIQANDGERFVLNPDGEQKRPGAEEIFKGFGLSDKDDKPLMPDESYTTRPLASMAKVTVEQPVEQPALEPEPKPEPQMQFVMPQSTGNVAFEPEKLFKFSDDRSSAEDASGLTFSSSAAGNGDFSDISASNTSFKFAEEEQEASTEADDFTLRSVTGSSATFEEYLETQKEQSEAEPSAAEPVEQMAAKPESVVIAPNESQTAISDMTVQEKPMPVEPVGAEIERGEPEFVQTVPVAEAEPVIETVRPARQTTIPAPQVEKPTRRVVVPRYIDDEPETEVYTPGEDRVRRGSQRGQTKQEGRSLSVQVPLTIPASQMGIKNIDNGMKLELKLELRLLEDGSLVPAMPTETPEVQPRQRIVSEPIPEMLEEPEKAEDGPSITELLSRMDQIMESFPGDEGNET